MQLTNCRSSFMRFLGRSSSLIAATCETLGMYELFPANYLSTGAMRIICGTIPGLCELGVYLVADEDMTLNEEARTQVYLGHFPSGTSLRTLNHYAQILAAKEFQKYDFGINVNKQKYGQAKPPIIPIENIKKVPIAMFVGTKDLLATVEDNRWAKTQIKSVVHYGEYEVGHLGFMVSKDMTYFTNDVIKVLQ